MYARYWNAIRLKVFVVSEEAKAIPIGQKRKTWSSRPVQTSSPDSMNFDYCL